MTKSDELILSKEKRARAISLATIMLSASDAPCEAKSAESVSMDEKDGSCAPPVAHAYYAHNVVNATKKMCDVMEKELDTANRDFRLIVAELITLLGNQSRVATSLGVDQSSISRIKQGSRPSSDLAERILAMRERLAVSKSAPERVPAAYQSTLRVDGEIVFGSEGGVVVPSEKEVPSEGLKFIEIDFPVPPSSHAYEVIGNAYYPRCQNGDIVVTTHAAMTYDEPIGWEAVVTLPDGRRFLRTVRQGVRKGRYTLESLVGPPMYDVALDKICKVGLIVPAGGWRIVEGAAKVRAAKEKTGG